MKDWTFETGIMIYINIWIAIKHIFGSSLIEQWNAVFTQLIYGAYLAVLYYLADYNEFSIDARRGNV